MTRSLTKALCALRLAAPLALAAFPALAQEGPITIHDPYARVMGGASGAIFFVVENAAGEEDRLLSAQSEVAERVGLHTHRDMGNGVMQMAEVPEGFVIPAGGSHALARGGDHIMLMGLRQALPEGDHFIVTLHFEKAGDLPIDVYVKNEDPAGAAMGGHDHSAHGHGAPASTSP